MSKYFSSLFHAPSHPHALSSSKPLPKSSAPLKHGDALVLLEAGADTLKTYPTGWNVSTVSPSSPNPLHPSTLNHTPPDLHQGHAHRSRPPARIPHLPPRPASHLISPVTAASPVTAEIILPESSPEPVMTNGDQSNGDKHEAATPDENTINSTDPIVLPLSLSVAFDAVDVESNKKAKTQNGTGNGTYTSNGTDPPLPSPSRRPKHPPPPPVQSSPPLSPSAPRSPFIAPLSPPASPSRSFIFPAHNSLGSPSQSGVVLSASPHTSPSNARATISPRLSSPSPTTRSPRLSLSPVNSLSPSNLPSLNRSPSTPESPKGVLVSSPSSPSLRSPPLLPTSPSTISLHVFPGETFVSPKDSPSYSPNHQSSSSPKSPQRQTTLSSPRTVSDTQRQSTALSSPRTVSDTVSQPDPSSPPSLTPPSPPSHPVSSEEPLEFGEWANAFEAVPPLSPSKLPSPIQYRPVLPKEQPSSLPCLLYEPPGSDLLPHRVVYINSKRAVLVKLDFPIMYYRYLDSGCLNHRDFAFDTALFAVECDPKTYEPVWEYSEGLGCECCSLKGMPSQSNFAQAVKFCESCGAHFCRQCDLTSHPKTTLKSLHVRTLMADIQTCQNLLGEDQAAAFQRTGPFRNQTVAPGTRTTTLEQFLAKLQDIAEAPEPEEPSIVVPRSDSDSEDEDLPKNSRFVVVEEDDPDVRPLSIHSNSVFSSELPSSVTPSRPSSSPRTESIKHLADALRQEQTHQADLLHRFQSSCQEYQYQFTTAFDQLLGRISSMLSESSGPSSSFASPSASPNDSYAPLFSCPPSSYFPSSSSSSGSSSSSLPSLLSTPSGSYFVSSTFSSPSSSSSLPLSPSSTSFVSSSSTSFLSPPLSRVSPLDTSLSPSSFLSPSSSSPISDSSPSALAIASPLSPSLFSFTLSPSSSTNSLSPTSTCTSAETTTSPHQRSTTTPHSLSSCSAASSTDHTNNDLDLWRTCFTAEGKKYYWHTVSDETSWVKPRRRQRMPGPGTFGLPGIRPGSCRAKGGPRSSSTPPAFPSSSFATAPISLPSETSPSRRRSATGLSLLARRLSENEEEETRSHTDTELQIRPSSPRRRRSFHRNREQEDDTSPASPAGYDSPSESSNSDDPYSPRDNDDGPSVAVHVFSQSSIQDEGDVQPHDKVAHDDDVTMHVDVPRNPSHPSMSNSSLRTIESNLTSPENQSSAGASVEDRIDE